MGRTMSTNKVMSAERVEKLRVFREFLIALKKSGEAVDSRLVMEAYLKTGNPDDCGLIGKATEITAKFVKNQKALNNDRVTKNNIPFDTTYTNKAKGISKIKIEIKTACGELAKSDDAGNITKLLKGADYIAYCPEVDLSIKIEQQLFVMTREDFINITQTYEGSGQVLRVKTSTSGESRVSFQSFYSKTRQSSSKKLANHIWDCCYNFPTWEEFLSK